MVSGGWQGSTKPELQFTSVLKDWLPRIVQRRLDYCGSQCCFPWIRLSEVQIFWGQKDAEREGCQSSLEEFWFGGVLQPFERSGKGT